MPSASTRIVSIEQLRALLPKTAPEALGVEIVSADSEHIVDRMPMSDRARQPLSVSVIAGLIAVMCTHFGFQLRKSPLSR
jgi:hypothetical protein